MVVKSILDLSLNDSDLLEVVIDKSDADGGKIILRLDYIEDYQSMNVSRRNLTFIGCKNAVLSMNFGVVTPDSIRSSNEFTESKLLDDAKSSLIRMNVVGKSDLKHFHIETSSTASKIDIVAEKLEIDGPIGSSSTA